MCPPPSLEVSAPGKAFFAPRAAQGVFPIPVFWRSYSARNLRRVCGSVVGHLLSTQKGLVKRAGRSFWERLSPASDPGGALPAASSNKTGHHG